jgi:hypothetical protein
MADDRRILKNLPQRSQRKIVGPDLVGTKAKAKSATKSRQNTWRAGTKSQNKSEKTKHFTQSPEGTGHKEICIAILRIADFKVCFSISQFHNFKIPQFSVPALRECSLIAFSTTQLLNYSTTL